MFVSRYFIGLLLLVVGFQATAIEFKDQSYLCRHPESEKRRVIELNYAEQGQATPCFVVYSKDSHKRTLWQAQNRAGYCEEKVRIFINKQSQWGWVCKSEKP